MTGALVVYESVLGNTQAVARAIAEGLGESRPVTVREVSQAPETIPPDVGLLVVGGPTHAFGLTRPETRAEARKEAPGQVVSTGVGLREWLDRLSPGDGSVPTVTFDTRVEHPHVPGSAAKKARKQLAHKGFPPFEEAHSFHVHGKAGPLVDDELGRARAWGQELGQHLHDREDAP